MTKIVKKTSMGNYELKGIHISGKRNVYIGTSVYPTCNYRGMDLPCGKTEAGYGMGVTGAGWLSGKYKHVNGEVIIIRQPMYPTQWTAEKRYNYFTRHYETYAKEADKWRKEHGVKEEIVEVPQHVKDTLGLMQGTHKVVYEGEVKELVRPIRHPSKKGVVVVKTGKAFGLSSVTAQGAAAVGRIGRYSVAVIIGFFVVLAILVGRKKI